MDRYLIVADDFTGANDTGVQLRRRGLATDVFFSARSGREWGDALVLDTESRALEPAAAYEAVRGAVAGLDLSAFGYVIKKVDSTLRGRIAQEVKALDEAMGAELVLFAPALPDLGRTTVDGVHLLKGIPVASTELARDPKNPVREDRIDKLLRQAYDEPVGRIPLAALRAGEPDFSGARVFACDAETNADMRALIRAASALGRRVLWVGTAAMADNLLEARGKSLPSLGVAASLSSVTRAQIAHARAAGTAVVELPVDELLRDPDSAPGYADRAAALLAEGRDVILASASSCDPDALARSDWAAAELGLCKEEVGDFTQKLIGELAFRVLEGRPVSGVFLTGGDTAISLFRRAGAEGSSILGEVATGIPMMRLRGGARTGSRSSPRRAPSATRTPSPTRCAN